MSADRGEAPKSLSEILVIEGYVVVPHLMKFERTDPYGNEVYIAVDVDSWGSGPRMPESNGVFINWMYLGLMEEEIVDPLDSRKNSRVGKYIFYDPKKIEIASEHDLFGFSKVNEEELRNNGWVPLERQRMNRSTNPEIPNPGEYFIRRLQKQDGIGDQASLTSGGL